MSEYHKPFKMNESVEYSEGSIVSKTVIKNSAGNVTLFAFDKGEALSEHTAPFNALAEILDGSAELTVGGTVYNVAAGESILLPANVPHAVSAIGKFKMCLTMIKG